jgi:archaellum component FlaF (FlaF/FlaG flagellin family)
MNKTSKKVLIALDKTNIFCYNTSMKSNNNNTNTTLTKKGNTMITKTKKLKERTILSNGFKFVYTPSLHSMGVHYPNGRLSIHHCLYGDQWFKVACQIMASHGHWTK